jgi:endonuclease YncB( thermonuclease family)
MVVSRGRWSGLVVALALAFVVAPVSAQRFAGRVLDVTDGDTVIVARGRGQVTVRLFGIDAPEGTQPFGREAAAMLSQRVLGKVVDVDMKDVDVYGRLVATISIDSRDIGEELVRAGAAWHYVQYSNDPRLAAAQREARAARRGLWKGALAAAAVDVPCEHHTCAAGGAATSRGRVSRQPRVQGAARPRLPALQLQELHGAVRDGGRGEGGGVSAA